MAQARDVHSLHEEHHAGEAGLLHLCRLQWPHGSGGKFFRVQTEKLSWKRAGEMAPVSVLPAGRAAQQSLCALQLPEEDEPRICLRVSAWLWLTGCMTSELALILGLYTFKRKEHL